MEKININKSAKSFWAEMGVGWEAENSSLHLGARSRGQGWGRGFAWVHSQRLDKDF